MLTQRSCSSDVSCSSVVCVYLLKPLFVYAWCIIPVGLVSEQVQCCGSVRHKCAALRLSDSALAALQRRARTPPNSNAAYCACPSQAVLLATQHMLTLTC
jgi:hypothetical protein